MWVCHLSPAALPAVARIMVTPVLPMSLVIFTTTVRRQSPAVTEIWDQQTNCEFSDWEFINSEGWRDLDNGKRKGVNKNNNNNNKKKTVKETGSRGSSLHGYRWPS